MHKIALSLAIIGLAVPLLSASLAQAQAARTWVSSAGNDTSPCSRTAPCKTFQGAHDKTSAGGEINCIDAGEFTDLPNTTLVINKSITISCEAGTASLATGSGIIIQAA